MPANIFVFLNLFGDSMFFLFSVVSLHMQYSKICNLYKPVERGKVDWQKNSEENMAWLVSSDICDIRDIF